MSKKEKKPAQPAQTEETGGLTEKRKRAMLIYIAVLLAAAFLLVTMSLLSEYRNLKRTNRKNQEASISISQKAEILQEDNQNIPKAYELLLTAMNAKEERNRKALNSALRELEPLSGYLSDQGAETYQALREFANMGKEG